MKTIHNDVDQYDGEDPGNYADSCDTCMVVTNQRPLFTAYPWRITPDGSTDRSGIRAFYRHECGRQWFTSWQRKSLYTKEAK